MSGAHFLIHDHYTKDEAIRYLEKLSLQRGAYMVRCELWSGRQTDGQRKRYWAIVAMVVEKTGMSREDVHREFKRKFIGTDTRKFGDREIEVAKDSHDLERRAFAEYCDQVEAYVAEFFEMRLPPRPRDR